MRRRVYLYGIIPVDVVQETWGEALGQVAGLLGLLFVVGLIALACWR